MNASMSAPSTPEGPGSASGAPNLPPGFTDTFTSRYVDTGALRQHAVIGGDGPPLLLIHGWPESWYAWRHVLPALARDFEVIAVDQRGMGLTDKPQDGYDSATLANDLVALMDALGHDRHRRPGRRDSGRRPLGCRAGSRGAAGRADHLPRSVPKPPGRADGGRAGGRGDPGSVARERHLFMAPVAGSAAAIGVKLEPRRTERSAST